MVASESPETRESLLIRVRDLQDRDAWDQFVQIYRPVVYRLARNRGLQDADAQDLAQKVLMSVAKSIPDWKRTEPNAKFRHWLKRVAKNATLNTLTRHPKDQACGGSSAAKRMQLPAASELTTDEEVDLEYRRQVYRRAAQIVRQRADEVTWQAFSMTMIEGIPVSEAAQKLDRSEGTVYAARSRIVKRLRDVVSELEDG